MPRSKASWIRSFAQQGMSREEIQGLLGVSRFVLNNALNRPLCDGELPVQPTDACAKCGSASFEQEPSCIGMARRCGACGAHYRYWTDRKKHREYTPHKGKAQPIPPQGRPRKQHCAGCGASPGRALAKFSGREEWQARHCWVCGASKSEWRLGDRDRVGSPNPPEAEAPKLKPMVPVRPRVCAREGCGVELASSGGVYTPEVLAARKRAVEKRMAELRAEANQTPDVQSHGETPRPKLGHKTQDVIDRHRAGMEEPLREQFEASAWNHMPKRLTAREQQDEADEWLRQHDRQLKRDRPVEDEPMPEAGTMSWSIGGHVNRQPLDTTDWRTELRAAATAGDEYAQRRCWELFDAPDEDEEAGEKSVA